MYKLHSENFVVKYCGYKKKKDVELWLVVIHCSYRFLVNQFHLFSSGDERCSCNTDKLALGLLYVTALHSSEASVVKWLCHSPCKPGVAGSIPVFSSQSDGTIDRGPVSI